MFLKNRNISSKIKRSKVKDYAALRNKVILITYSYLGVWVTCVDPESSIRGGSTNTGVLRGGGSKYHYKRAIINPPALGHLNDVSLACRLWPNIECWLGRLVIVQGVRTSIAKKYYMFVVFQGGGRTPWSPLWVRAWVIYLNIIDTWDFACFLVVIFCIHAKKLKFNQLIFSSFYNPGTFSHNIIQAIVIQVRWNNQSRRLCKCLST